MSQTIVTPPLSHVVRRALVRTWEDPDSRSVLIGVLGTILIHLLLLLLGPRLLRSDAPHVLMRPHASARQFSIEIAPDTFKKPPKPKPPMKFVETNPDAPENVPDNTNNFAARNQQVAQEKPTPNGKSDRPAMEGQKEIHSTQIVTGQLLKPMEQTPVPPSPDAKPSESKLTAPRLEQSPLTGIEKQIGEDATAFGSNIAKFAENPKNIPEKIDGLKNVPLIEGATAMQPAIDPHHPRARPQVVKTMQTRPAIFEENKVGTFNVGLRGIDAKWSNYGMYLQKMVEIIQVEFDKLNDESRIYPPSGSMVTVKFILDSEGKIARIISVESKATDAAARTCTSSITIPSPYGPWTDDMKAILGEEQELIFDFYYQ
jgi:hypothetical protein